MKMRNPASMNEEGFVLVTAILLLAILTIIGLMAADTGVVELNVSGNDRMQKASFFEADGGAQAGRALLEANFSCPGGFTNPNPAAPFRPDDGGMVVDALAAQVFSGPKDLDFTEIGPDECQQLADADTPPVADCPRYFIRHGDDAAGATRFRHAMIGAAGNGPHTNLLYTSKSAMGTGSAIHQVSGYAGMGYGAAGGGGLVLTTILSDHEGLNNSRAMVRTLWRHVIGLQGRCRYR